VTVFVARADVLRTLLADPVWKARFMKARNTAEMQQVIVEFGRAKGFEIVEVGVAA